MASTQAKAGAAAAVGGAALLIALGVMSANPSANRRHTTVHWDGGVPAGAKCFYVTAMAADQVLDMFGLDRDGGPYVRARVCAQPRDGGSLDLPSGLVAVPGTDEEETDYVNGLPQIEGWQPGDPSNPMACACSSGASCERYKPLNDGGWEWVQEPKTGNTMDKDMWRGTGCVRKPCVELAGLSSMPSECK